MDLSLWILAEKLEKYNPVLFVNSGEDVICGIRLLSDDVDCKSSSFVYIAKASDFFQYPCMNCKVFCINRNDWIVFDADNFDAFMNDLLAVFDEFRIWHNALMDASKSRKTIQDYIDISTDIIGNPAIVFDVFGDVVAYTKKYQNADIDEYWSEMISSRRMPSNLLYSNMLDEDLQPSDRPQIDNSSPRRCCIGRFYVNGIEVGALCILEYDRKVGNGTCHIAKHFCRIVSDALSDSGEDAELKVVPDILENLLYGREIEESILQRAIDYQLGKTEYYKVILTQKISSHPQSTKDSLLIRCLLAQVRSHKTTICSFFIEGDIISIIKDSDEKQALESLCHIFSGKDFIFGISLPFDRILQAPAAVKQSQIANLRGEQNPGSVNYCLDYVFDYFLEELGKGLFSNKNLFHPAISFLKKYDETNNMNLYRTLYEYILNERNITATSKALFVHRNTLLYRLQKITQLLNLNLDDANVRMYLLLSYKMDMQNQS